MMYLYFVMNCRENKITGTFKQIYYIRIRKKYIRKQIKSYEMDLNKPFMFRVNI